MKTKLFLAITLIFSSIMASANAGKTYYVRNKAEIETEKEIIIIKEIGSYRIFKVCDLIAYLHNGTADLDNPEECQSIGNGIYKYNTADLMQYKNDLAEEAAKYGRIDNALTTSSALAAVYTYGQYIIKHVSYFDWNRDDNMIKTFRNNKKSYYLGTLFAVTTGYLSSIADDYESRADLLAGVLKTATQPVAANTEFKTDLKISEFVGELHEMLSLGVRNGTFEAVEVE